MKKNNNEIIWNIVNSILAGIISFLSSILTLITIKDLQIENLKISLAISTATALLTMAYKFKDYWEGEKKEYTHKLINFL